MKEEFLIYLWAQKLLNPDLYVQDNSTITILNPGYRNHDSGPDFFNARIKIASEIWAGNIEIHVKSSDWNKHGHSNDKAYDNIILHVVYDDDSPVKRTNGQLIECLEIKHNFNHEILDKYLDFISARTWIACENMISRIGHFELHNWLDCLTIERLENRTQDILTKLNNNKYDFQEVFYHKLARAYGFNINSAAFELLAAYTPLNILYKHRNNILQLEAILYGQAGLLSQDFKDNYPQELKREFLFLSHKYGLIPMNKKLWKFMRSRPTNFPSIRISQFASFIQKSEAILTQIFETKKLKTVENLLQTKASPYWNNHYRFDLPATKSVPKKLGKASVNLLLINTIIPFMFTYGHLNNLPKLKNQSIDWLEEIQAESNIITRKFSKHNIKPINAFQSQALIQLFKGYCTEKRCLDCRIGQKLLNKI